MRKKVSVILVCMLMITTMSVSLAMSISVSSDNLSSNQNNKTLNTFDKCAYSNKGSNLDKWGITPPIELDSPAQVILSLLQLYDIQDPDYGYIKISDNGGSSWDVLQEVQGYSEEEWEIVEINIDSYAGKTVLIGFEYKTSSNSISQGWYVDRLEVFVNGISEYSEDFEEYDIDDYWEDWIIAVKINSHNQPPTIPTIKGPTSGKAGQPLTYTFKSIDVNLDNISYYIEWGDGTISESEYYDSASAGHIESHKWAKKNNYEIKAKAIDEKGAESDWSTFEVTITRSKILSYEFSLISYLYEKFPLIFTIIECLL